MRFRTDGRWRGTGKGLDALILMDRMEVIGSGHRWILVILEIGHIGNALHVLLRKLHLLLLIILLSLRHLMVILLPLLPKVHLLLLVVRRLLHCTV